MVAYAKNIVTFAGLLLFLNDQTMHYTIKFYNDSKMNET
jgi:hypothetical protein